jgi:hypothetical protein
VGDRAGETRNRGTPGPGKTCRNAKPLAVQEKIAPSYPASRIGLSLYFVYFHQLTQLYRTHKRLSMAHLKKHTQKAADAYGGAVAKKTTIKLCFPAQLQTIRDSNP